jgi:rod shape-determining protein MreC
MILVLSSRQPYPTHSRSRIAIAVVAPFQKAIGNTVRFFNGIWDHYFFLISVVDENQRLRQKAQQTMALEHRCQEAVQANERLQELLNLSREIEKPSIAARVVGKDPSPWFQTVLIDKGLKDDIQVGYPVINPQGIVGLVIEAASHYAKVMLITDPNSAVDAIVQKNRARGIIKGGTVGYCVFNFVLRKHDINIGDTVVSSGMDGVFPKGLAIGQVTQVEKKEAGIFQEVTVTPYVDFERLEEVLIVPIQAPVIPS